MTSAEAGAAAAFATAQQVASLVASAMEAEQLDDAGVTTELPDAPPAAAPEETLPLGDGGAVELESEADDEDDDVDSPRTSSPSALPAIEPHTEHPGPGARTTGDTP
jgi:hypothetical protein